MRSTCNRRSRRGSAILIAVIVGFALVATLLVALLMRSGPGVAVQIAPTIQVGIDTTIQGPLGPTSDPTETSVPDQPDPPDLPPPVASAATDTAGDIPEWTGADDPVPGDAGSADGAAGSGGPDGSTTATGDGSTGGPEVDGPVAGADPEESTAGTEPAGPDVADGGDGGGSGATSTEVL